MKIVSVMTTSSAGGAEFAAVEMLDALSARGHDVVLLSDMPGIERDTSVAIGWIAEETGAEVVCVAADVGQGGEDMNDIRQRALDCGEQSMLPGAAPDDTTWQVRRGIARIHFAREDYASAADCLTHAVALNPSSPELRVMLAQAYEGAGRSGEARRHLELAVAGAPGGADAYLAFGDFFARKAEEALLRGLVDNAESRALLEQIERLREARGTA